MRRKEVGKYTRRSCLRQDRPSAGRQLKTSAAPRRSPALHPRLPATSTRYPRPGPVSPCPPATARRDAGPRPESRRRVRDPPIVARSPFPGLVGSRGMLPGPARRSPRFCRSGSAPILRGSLLLCCRRCWASASAREAGCGCGARCRTGRRRR